MTNARGTGTDTTARKSPMQRRVFFLFLVVAGLLGMLFAARPEAIGFSVWLLDSVPHGSLLVCALLIAANEFLKGARWGVFLRASRVRIGLWDAISTQIASQSINVLPGNEWLAARLVEEHSPGNRSKTAQATPAIIVRWICDVIAVSIIATVGMAYFRGFTPATLLPIPVVLVVAMLLRAKTPSHWLARRLARWERTRGLIHSERAFHLASCGLIQPRVLLAGVALCTATTAVAALSLYTLVHGTGSEIFGLPQAFVAQSLISLTAMFAVVPNGFGVVEGSIAGWLYFFGVGLGPIAFVTVTLRIMNIVVRTAVGIAMVLTRYRFLWAGGGRQFVRRMLRGEIPASSLAKPAPVPVPLPIAVDSIERG